MISRVWVVHVCTCPDTSSMFDVWSMQWLWQLEEMLLPSTERCHSGCLRESVTHPQADGGRSSRGTKCEFTAMAVLLECFGRVLEVGFWWVWFWCAFDVGRCAQYREQARENPQRKVLASSALISFWPCHLFLFKNHKHPTFLKRNSI
jgi:hypothetical protein